MKRWKLMLLILSLLIITLLIKFPLNLNASSSKPADFTGDVVKNYTEDLRPQREACYNDILLLGTLTNPQLQARKIELQAYLNELNDIKNVIISNNINNRNLYTSIELDIMLIKNTLRAIETKDESYLSDVSEMYYNLLQYQRLL
ncbi:hypothetical protein ACTHOQ_11140 [Solibacillus silvestris]|uniref:hypothetical protein n=1 Tax=Solibacillus silvestris TaxID=76853 RepID=UPI003F7D108E